MGGKYTSKVVLLEDAALEEDPADDQPQEEECDVLTHQSTDSVSYTHLTLPTTILV